MQPLSTKFTLSHFRAHLIQSTAGAALLGGGVAIIGNKVDTARMDERVKVVEQIPSKVDELIELQMTTNERLARIETKLEK